MIRCCFWLVLVLATATGSARGAENTSARKRVRAESGLELSLAAGWGAPHGQRDSDTDLSRLLIGQVPAEASAGYRTGFGLSAFAQARYGAVIGRDCSSGCSGSVTRLGLSLEYHFTPEDRIDHYVGLGAGYEWLGFDAGVSRLRYRGPEWLSLSFGEEFSIGPVGIGPLLSLALGRFTHQEIDAPPARPLEGPIEKRAVHVWLTLGVRVSYGWR
jgi:hypothetical protein